jgi:Fic family protein
MSQWLNNLNASLANTYTSLEATSVYADLHLSFVSIHPFFDGNGRMARLLANLPVLKSGFPPIVVPQEDRYQYKLVLSAYQNTIPDLVGLGDLKQFPDNHEKQHFVDLCHGYWKETIDLLNKANEMQEKRNYGC